ncbi:MAG TPA: ABC transporter ATP-binding protein, partial [Acetobacteraceae bacterium]|nr:ABC transporter ATP-binding protein [Acetobacteraceae bacterium]
MSVFDNIAYGLRVRKLPENQVAANVTRVLELVHMTGFGDRPAFKLSGGQQQRVAVARAIAFSPGVLLLDEPLSNLDARLRTDMRVELRELQRRLEITSLYVTHDQEEALAISDRVIVMNEGRIEQIGTPEDVYARPESRFVADFVGSTNLIPGRMATGGFEAAGGTMLRVGMVRADATLVAVRSAHIRLLSNGAADAGNIIPGQIHRRMFHGDFIQYVVDSAVGQLIVRRPPTELFDEGGAVTLAFAPEHCVPL